MTKSIKHTVGNSSSLRLVYKKNRPEKFPFKATNNRVSLAVQDGFENYCAERKS